MAVTYSNPAMPRIKAAKKALRQSQKRYLKNRSEKRRIQEAIREFRSLALAKKIEEAKQKLPTIQALLDKAAKRNLYHPNKSARKKSQLARLIK